MIANALKGYRMKLLMPDNSCRERRAAMRAYGAELILQVTKIQEWKRGARFSARYVRNEQQIADQFNNPDNPLYAHYTTTGLKSAANVRSHHPFCLQHGHDRQLLPACVAFSARAEKAGDDCRFAAGRGQQYSGTAAGRRVYAVDNASPVDQS